MSTNGRYYWHQLDLLLQSGWLNEVADLELLDAIAEGLTPEQALERATARDWDFVLFLTGEKSMPEDQKFIEKLTAALPGTIFFASGDVVYFRGEKPFSEYCNLRGIITDFGADGLARYIRGERGPLPGLRYLDEEGKCFHELQVTGPLSYPRPRHDLFDSKFYRSRFGTPRPFASVLSNFGCPYSCAFCNAKNVGYRPRPVEEVLEELTDLKRFGFRRVYFRDPTFAARREHGLELCRKMNERGLCLEWNAITRPDVLDEELIEAMGASGCNLLEFGLETPDLEVLKQYQKFFQVEQLKATIARCHKAGIECSGHFMLGFPGEDISKWDRIVDFAQYIGCDYIALSPAEVRLGTSLDSALPATELDRTKLYFDGDLLRRGVERLNRKFYLSPGYLWKQLGNIRSPSHLMHLMNFGLQLLIAGKTSR